MECPEGKIEKNHKSQKITGTVKEKARIGSQSAGAKDMKKRLFAQAPKETPGGHVSQNYNLSVIKKKKAQTEHENPVKHDR